jgi:hypothetical protein
MINHVQSKHPRHSWWQQDGFRVEKCEYCGALRYWDSGYARIMYKKELAENVYGPALYYTPTCKFVIATDIPIKM